MNNTTLLISVFVTGIVCFMIGYHAGTKETRKSLNSLLNELWTYIEKQDQAIKRIEPFLDEKMEEYQALIKAEKMKK